MPDRSWTTNLDGEGYARLAPDDARITEENDGAVQEDGQRGRRKPLRGKLRREILKIIGRY